MAKRSFDDFDDYAHSYRKLHDKNVKYSGASSHYFANHKASLVGQQENQLHLRLLDFGCGDGANTNSLHRQMPAASIWGIDVSEKSIAVAKQHYPAPLHFLWYDGTTIPFEDNHFDVVFVANVFHHVAFELHESLLKEIYRVLKHGGRLHFFEHNPLNPATKYLVRTCPFDKDAKLLSYGYAGKLLQRAGFKDISRKFILFFPRNGGWKKLHRFESKMSKIPLGAQYYFRALK